MSTPVLSAPARPAPAGTASSVAWRIGWLLAVAACAPAPEQGPRAALDLAHAQLDSSPRRIVPSSARALEFVAALVGPGRLAGLPEQGFEYATLGADEARFAELPRFHVYQAEPVLALDPDLVLGDPWQPGDTDARLREAGVPVVLIPATVGWREAAAVLEDLGRLLGEPSRARDLALDLERRVVALERTRGQRADLSVLPYSNFGSQGFSAGAGTTLDEVLRLAGVTNAAAAAGHRGHVTMGFEELLVLDPDVIVVSAPLRTGVGHAGDRGGASEQVLRSEPSLAGLRAVREGRIVALPPGLYASASHLVVQAAEELARELDALPSRTPAEPGGQGR